jgi:hypothetical protein
LQLRSSMTGGIEFPVDARQTFVVVRDRLF